MAYARRKDSTHREVIQAFEACGWTVCDISRSPFCPDLMVAKAGRVVAVEIKSPRGKRRTHQLAWAEKWPADYALITSAEQVVKEYGR